MKRILLALALVLAAPAWAAGNWGSNTTINVGQCRTFTFGGSDAANAQPDIRVQAGELAFTAIATNGTAVSVTFWYVDAASDDPATVGTLAATVTGTGRFPAKAETNGGILDVDIDTDGDGGSVKVCSAGYANAGRSGAGASQPLAFAAGTVSLSSGDCTGKVITIGSVAGQVLTLPINPVSGLTCRFLVTGMRSLTVDVQGTTGCTLGAACDRIASHTNLGGDRVASPPLTAFGDVLACLATDADSWHCQDAQSRWEDLN